MKTIIPLCIFTLLSTLPLTFAETICVAHRGNNAEFLENSSAAIISAAEMDAPGIEFDVQHTKDGVPIIMHDKTLKRTTLDNGTCPRSKEIKSLTFTEIKRNCLLKDNAPIPSLDETLNYLTTSSSHPYIELKDHPNVNTIEILKKHYLEKPEDLVIISFKSSYLSWVNNKRKDYPFLKQVTLIWVNKKSKNSIASYLNGIDVKKLKKRHFKALKKKALIVGVWTKNSEKSINYYKDLGVDFITTNHIRRCLTL